MAEKVLTTSSIEEKVRKTKLYVAAWKDGRIALVKDNINDSDVSVPDVPARPESVTMVAMNKVKQGSLKAMVHSIAHAESYAIDLMWDIVSRFTHYNLPKEFYDDWVRVAGEEGEHYQSWADRLVDFGSFYGELPGHARLWDSATDTADSLEARLAIVHMVHEARGLDTFPMALKKLTKAKDEISLKIIHKNHSEEVTHVGAAVKWFNFLCERDHEGKDPKLFFQQIVTERFPGALKPPFNHEARNKAKFHEDWYLPLAAKK